jgi:hypothetical protein
LRSRVTRIQNSVAPSVIGSENQHDDRPAVIKVVAHRLQDLLTNGAKYGNREAGREASHHPLAMQGKLAFADEHERLDECEDHERRPGRDDCLGDRLLSVMIFIAAPVVLLFFRMNGNSS